ncbi:hypothetical protein [Streptomyces sp. NPDC048639]|uniref:hypothetical protein n=1 Tax=Streptomyces sp. NPDC048639 TaxID=3365581 RepID=UPI00371335A1
MERSPSADVHCHAYAWIGPRRLFDLEEERRPEFEAAFAVSDVTPVRVVEWLRKPRRLIRSTFTDPAEAASWIRARAAEVLPELLHPEEADWPALDRREKSAADMIGRGGDVVWGFYLRDGRFASYALISCPNRLEPGLPCPERGP